METRIKLNNFITSLAQKNIISITRLDWTIKNNLDLYDYLIELHIGEFKTTGRGTSENESEAVIIAFSEAVERLIIKEHGIANSNGCAVHTDKNKSATNSKNELIERDCFLCYFYLGSDLKKVIVRDRNNLTLFFEKLGITYRNYLLYSADIHICLNVIYSKSGLIIGLGTSDDRNWSIYKSMVESIRQYIHLVHYNNNQSISLKEFKLIQKYTFNDHGNLLFDSEYRSTILSAFKTKNILKYHYPVDDFTSTQYNSLVFPDLPLIFTQTFNNNLQTLFLGDAHNNLNLNRLNQFKMPPTNNLINYMPHPLR